MPEPDPTASALVTACQSPPVRFRHEGVSAMVMVLVAMVLAVGAAGAGVWAAVGAMRRAVDTRLGEAGAELRRVADSAAWRERGTEDIRREVASFRDSLERMGTREEERLHREEEAWAVLHRVSSVLAGSQRAGRVGENVLRESLVHLPPTMLVREVAGYRDAAITAPIGVAAVPDAAYGVLRRAHADAYRQGVVVIPYSMALPIVLFLH